MWYIYSTSLLKINISYADNVYIKKVIICTANSI